MTLIPDALDAASPTLRDIAEDAKASYASIRAWRLGTRTPTPDGQRKLAQALRKHAKRLDRFADRLERSIPEA